MENPAAQGRKHYEMSFYEILATSVARMGPTPNHMAIIMDGNRRFARAKGLKVMHGHEAGSTILDGVEEWRKAIGCKELTIYVFSSENFKRTKDEVDNLMELIFRRSEDTMNDVKSGKNTDMCVQFIGNWERSPEKLKNRIANVMEITKDFKPYKLNVALAFTGREGILRSLQAFTGWKDETPTKTSESEENSLGWNEYLIEQAQHSAHMRPIDILIRSGGDQRYSDFMMWEASQAYIHFTSETWPEFNFNQFMDAIWKYQVFRRQLIHKPISAKASLSPEEARKSEEILDKSRIKMWTRIGRMAKKDVPPEGTCIPYVVNNQWLDAFQKVLKF
ncbi:isoprenyl transferase isoform X1 [Folsomia candida]|nr:isoprenyl transferase isoform X1 [Folsomia candida]